jgi:3-oxoadipate enol-lactonase
MIAQVFAAAYPEMVSALVLCDTTCSVGPEAGPMWDERIAVARREGMEPHVEPTIARWFTPPFIADHPEIVDGVREMIRATDPRGYAACGQAVKALAPPARVGGFAAPG